MKKLAAILLHLVIWSIVLVLPLFFSFSSNNEIPREISVYYAITAIFHPVIFYIFYFGIIPLTIHKRQINIYTLLIFIAFSVGLMLLRHRTVKLIDHLSNLDFGKHELYSARQIISESINTIFIVFLATAFKISLYWYREQREKTELALQEHKMELELLKAQINPHFFFNTLNNIYSLVYKKSDDAPAAVMKLSEIMRYLIYESKSEMVPLEKEVEQLENYIELERLRAKDPAFIDYETRGSFSAHVIPPMLLISFAENAFKHGKRKVANPGIHISVIAEEGLVKYTVTNFILNEPHNNHQGEGIGMQNTRRRLQLLYPRCHRLEIKKEHEKFTVRLTLGCTN